MHHRPERAAEIPDLIRDAGLRKASLDIIGRATKHGWGEASSASDTLDLSRLTGITALEPEELIITAQAGTTIAEISEALRPARQRLAFEPPEFYGIWSDHHQTDQPEQSGTLGGTIACNLSGPLRFRFGAARDNLLGVHFVNGRGEAIRTGGTVFKNVAGYDLCKILCGSFGTLGVMTEITVKALPAPESEQTLAVMGLTAEQAQRCLQFVASNPFDLVSAGLLPSRLVRALATLKRIGSLDDIADCGSLTLFRLEGPEPALSARMTELRAALRDRGKTTVFDRADSQTLWQTMARVELLAKTEFSVLWRIHAPPARLAAFADWVAANHPAAGWFADWCGGLLWLGLQDEEQANNTLRDWLGPYDGAYAVLLRAPAPIRRSITAFHPLPDGLARLNRRLKDSLDPMRLFNPGRMG